MSFSYLASGSFNNTDRVRFHIGDTQEDGAAFSDEEINAVITEAGGVNPAVILLLKNLIAQLSTPDFRADWLQVTNSQARAGYEKLLREKRAEFGIPALTATATHVYRKDSRQTEAPDYSDENTDEDEGGIWVRIP